MIYTSPMTIRKTAAGIAWLMLWSAVGFSQTPQTPQPGSGPARARFFTPDSRAEVRVYHLDDANVDVPYCVFKSSKVSPDHPAPLIISLHGWGAGPQIMCNRTAIDLAEQGGYVLAAPMGYSVGGWYGAPVMILRDRSGVSAAGPSAKDVAKWSEEDVMNVLAMLRREFNIDPRRIYLTGHSMGGAGTYFLGAKHADIWAAIAPVAPAAFLMNDHRFDILKSIKDGGVPILVAQGDADEAVPVANTRLWVQEMKNLNMNYKYVELPGITHGPALIASQKDVYAFFAEHSKNK
jgi:predicted peptidase